MGDAFFSEEIFHDEDKAIEYLQKVRWPNGPVCPHCGKQVKAYPITGKRRRKGLLKCADCKKQFTVKVGTVFESSHIPVHKWLQATHFIASSKKGMSTHQLHRTLNITYKSTWFMTHRIREAMRTGDLAPFGASGGSVESDETFIGKEEGKPKKTGFQHKRKVLSLIDRESGSARSFVVDNVNAKTIVPILKENINKEARILTDDAGQYRFLKDDFADHRVVCHSRKEYVSPQDDTIHVNCAENFFSIFKRGMKGVYQHCAKHHLHRYLAEFDFRYTNRCAKKIDDTERCYLALRGIEGKRLTYRGFN